MTDITARNHVTITGDDERIIMFAHGFGCDQACGNIFCLRSRSIRWINSRISSGS